MEPIKLKIKNIIEKILNGDNSLKDAWSNDGLGWLRNKYTDTYVIIGGDYQVGKLEAFDFVKKTFEEAQS